MFRKHVSDILDLYLDYINPSIQEIIKKKVNWQTLKNAGCAII